MLRSGSTLPVQISFSVMLCYFYAFIAVEKIKKIVFFGSCNAAKQVKRKSKRGQ
jgi:hypothetical protein